MLTLRLRQNEGKAFLVKNDEFPAVFKALADRSVHSIFGAYFLLTASIAKDKFRTIRQVLLSLAQAQSRGVDVKLLSGWPSRERSQGRNLVAARFLSYRDVPVRMDLDNPFHFKFCVFDEIVCLVGSHNITTGAFIDNVEISIALPDSSVAAELTSLHTKIWKSAKPLADLTQ